MLRLQKLFGKVQGNLSQALTPPRRALIQKVLPPTKWPISRAAFQAASLPQQLDPFRRSGPPRKAAAAKIGRPTPSAYSYRSADSGSILAARHAGIQQASA